MNYFTSGTIVGGLAIAAALSNAFHYPVLGAFLSDPTTAQSLTSVLTGVLALGAGALKGVHAK